MVNQLETGKFFRWEGFGLKECKAGRHYLQEGPQVGKFLTAWCRLCLKFSRQLPGCAIRPKKHNLMQKSQTAQSWIRGYIIIPTFLLSLTPDFVLSIPLSVVQPSLDSPKCFISCSTIKSSHLSLTTVAQNFRCTIWLSVSRPEPIIETGLQPHVMFCVWIWGCSCGFDWAVMGWESAQQGWIQNI